MENCYRYQSGLPNKLGAAAVIAGASAAGLLLFGTQTVSHAQAPAGMGIVWQDEFTGAQYGGGPNTNRWAFDTGAGGWGNNELETYTTSTANAHITWDSTGTDNQSLCITATNSTGIWTSARINTSGKESFGPYGYYEARCKFPNAGDGYWPAFWMLGNNIGSVGWPTCGEIDIAEEINGQWENHQSLHMPGWNPTLETSPNSSTTTYHNYGANWQPNAVTFYVDGQATGTFSNGGGGTWEFNNQQMYILLNCAVGGNFPGNPDGSTQGTGTFWTDYVRVYEAGAQLIPNGRYQIVAGTTGNVLDYQNGNDSNGTAVQLWSPLLTFNQGWWVTSLGNGYYSIIANGANGAPSGESLDCEGCSPNNNTLLDLWGYWGGACQQWGITPLGGGLFQIYSAGVNSSGGHDVIDGYGCSGAQGAQVGLWTWDGGGCQQSWDFSPM